MTINSNINRFIVTSVLMLATASTCFASFPSITDDTSTQGAGGNQLDFIYLFERETNGSLELDGVSLDEENSTANFLLSTYTRGLTDNLDIYFGVSRQLSQINGWNNTEIGLKWSFAGDQSEGWSFAVKPRIILPVTSGMQGSGLGNAQTNGGLTLISSYLTDDAELHLNASYISNRESSSSEGDAQRTNIWSVSAAPIWVINDQWKLSLDFGLQTNPDQNSQYLAQAEIAVIYAPVKDLQLGLGILTTPAINGQRKNNSLNIATSVTWQF